MLAKNDDHHIITAPTASEGTVVHVAGGKMIILFVACDSLPSTKHLFAPSKIIISGKSGISPIWTRANGEIAVLLLQVHST